MNPEPPNPPAANNSRTVRRLAWAVLILISGTLLVAVVAAVLAAGSGALAVLIVALYFGGFFALQFAFHPIRGRTDESQSWKERFPTHTDQEVQRFLRIVGESLALREDHRCRLRPDDRVRDLTQEVFCGDGMDIVKLVMALEDEYGLELPESGLEAWRTLGDVFDYVTQHCSPRPVSPAAARPEQLAGGWRRAQPNHHES